MVDFQKSFFALVVSFGNVPKISMNPLVTIHTKLIIKPAENSASSIALTADKIQHIKYTKNVIPDRLPSQISEKLTTPLISNHCPK